LCISSTLLSLQKRLNRFGLELATVQSCLAQICLTFLNYVCILNQNE
jgi:hypothetical protein